MEVNSFLIFFQLIKALGFIAFKEWRGAWATHQSVLSLFFNSINKYLQYTEDQR